MRKKITTTVLLWNFLYLCALFSAGGTMVKTGNIISKIKLLHNEKRYSSEELPIGCFQRHVE
jgi:hypothetical protein